MTTQIFLVDASTFIHRSYHALRGLSAKNGAPTSAVFGFTGVLNKFLKDHCPEYMAVVFDSKGPTFRHALYPAYKANRPPMPEDLIVQQEPIREIVRAMGLKIVEKPGLEADDLVATLARRAVDAGYEAVIVAGDKDYYQLLSDRVTLRDPNPNRETEMTPAALMAKLGLAPAGFLEAQGLMGDSTDNIPGARGVGEKTAVKLIQEFETLENLYLNLDRVPQAKLRAKLEEYRDSVFLSRDLARLKTDADLSEEISDLRVQPPDADALRKVYNELDFTTFAAELGPERTISYDDYHLVDDPDALDRLVGELSGAARLSVDLETTSIDPMRAEIVGMSLAARPHRAFYIPTAHQTLGARQLPWETIREKLRPLLESPDIPKVGQNIKYDLIILRRHGVNLGPVADDSMVASYLLEPGVGGHNLDRLARHYLGHDTITYKQAVGAKNKGFDQISPEEAREYACEDADVALILAGKLRPLLHEAGLTALYETVELPLIEVLAEMEMNGVYLDRALLAELSQEFSRKMRRLEQRIHELAGREFNINSPKQLGHLLFEELKLPQGKKTKKKSGYSTDVEVLTELAQVHELPAEVLNYRGLAKLRSTYVDALRDLINPATGRVHTSFNQAVTATGRLSSSDPNLQNIPIRTEEGRRIREAFAAEPGKKILSADYSQIELRVLAHYSRDQNLMDAFARGEDVHTRTAAQVFGVPPGLVSSQMRREAKAINFGIIYGQQAFGLSRQLGIGKKEAQDLIDRYFLQYSGVKDYIDRTLAEAHKTGLVSTLLGRRRALPDLDSKNYQNRSLAERMAINTPIQGAAADLIKLAMLGVHKALHQAGLKTKMILQVHDELVFEVPADELEAVAALVKSEMEGVHPLDAPLVVDVSHGDNWAEAH
ncbi:MAG: DNA polymerase I [Pseudomonadota bacterium]